MTSMSFITGTGFMKCMPITFSGREVAAARRVIEIELVLVARMVGRRAQAVEVGEHLGLDLQPLDHRLDHEVGVGEGREVARRSSAVRAPASRSSAVSFPLATSRSSPLPIWAAPRSSAAGAASTSTTSYPLCAATWAIPCPIVPAPTTPIVRISMKADPFPRAPQCGGVGSSV